MTPKQLKQARIAAAYGASLPRIAHMLNLTLLTVALGLTRKETCVPAAE